MAVPIPCSPIHGRRRVPTPAPWRRHRAERHDASGSWGDPKQWILLDDPLEVAQWRPAVDRKEWAGAGCELEILAQDRGAITGEVLNQGHVLARALQQNSNLSDQLS
jgi:hypothetical protein